MVEFIYLFIGIMKNWTIFTHLFHFLIERAIKSNCQKLLIIFQFSNLRSIKTEKKNKNSVEILVEYVYFYVEIE